MAIDFRPIKQGAKIDFAPSKKVDFVSNARTEDKRGLLEKTKDYIVLANRVPTDVMLGQAKGIGSSIFGAGKAGAAMLGPVAQVGAGILEKARASITGTPQKPILDASRVPEKPALLKPQGWAQNIGFASEQLGELLVPTGLGKTTSGVLGGLAKPGSVASKALGVIGAGIGEGVDMGTKTAIQTGGDKQKTAFSAGISFALPVAGAVLKAPFSSVSERLYKSALKPTGALRSKADELARTGLDERVWLTQGGVEKAAQKIDDFENQLGAAIDDASKKGKSVKLSGMKDYLDEAKQWLSYNFDVKHAERDAKAIDDLYENFIAKYGDEIPVAEAQKIKVATGQRLAKFYDKMTDVAHIEGLKQGTRYLKDQIVENAPMVGDINARLGKLYKLDKALDGAKGRLGNLNLLGLGAKFGMAASGSKGAAMGILADLLDSAMWKSGAAIGVNEVASVLQKTSQQAGIPLNVLMRHLVDFSRGAPKQ